MRRSPIINESPLIYLPWRGNTKIKDCVVPSGQCGSFYRNPWALPKAKLCCTFSAICKALKTKKPSQSFVSIRVHSWFKFQRFIGTRPPKGGTTNLKTHPSSFLCSLRSFAVKKLASFAARREPRPPKTFTLIRVNSCAFVVRISAVQQHQTA